MPNSDPSVCLKSNDLTMRKAAVKIPSDIAYIRKASSKVLESLERHGVSDESMLFDVKLSVEEAVRNAIVHGNKNDKNLPVKVSFWMDQNAITIEVEDRGKGFDYRNLPDPTVDANLEKNSGRGVYLIRGLMDMVEYNVEGNVLRMVKNLQDR